VWIATTARSMNERVLDVGMEFSHTLAECGP
jgi:hypothetical protein